MIALDSDHLSILQHPESPQFERLVNSLEKSTDSDVVTTVISLEEQMRGWLAAINRTRDVQDQTQYYLRLASLADFYSHWNILPFHDQAAQQFAVFRKERIRIGTMDLKIAAIAISHGATLLSANLRDFEQVPGLHVENWLSQ